MESFLHNLKTELVDHRCYATCADAQRDLFAFIEGFYNQIRVHSELGYLSPAEIERKAKLTPFTTSVEDHPSGTGIYEGLSQYSW